MPKNNFGNVEALLKEGEWKKIEALFDEIMKNRDPKATPYVDAMTLYAKVHNFLNRQYLERMEKALALLKKMDIVEKKFDSDVGIAKVKEKIKKIK